MYFIISLFSQNLWQLYAFEIIKAISFIAHLKIFCMKQMLKKIVSTWFPEISSTVCSVQVSLSFLAEAYFSPNFLGYSCFHFYVLSYFFIFQKILAIKYCQSQKSQTICCQLENILPGKDIENEFNDDSWFPETVSTDNSIWIDPSYYNGNNFKSQFP